MAAGDLILGLVAFGRPKFACGCVDCSSWGTANIQYTREVGSGGCAVVPNYNAPPPREGGLYGEFWGSSDDPDLSNLNGTFIGTYVSPGLWDFGLTGTVSLQEYPGTCTFSLGEVAGYSVYSFAQCISGTIQVTDYIDLSPDGDPLPFSADPLNPFPIVVTASTVIPLIT